MPHLRCEGISKTFGGVHAVNNVTLEFSDSVITAIIGPNGAGKTTLVNVLTGFLRPDRGRCFLGSSEATNMAPDRIARMGLARTFQDLRLIYQIPVMDNLMLARPNQRGERLIPAITRLGVAMEERKHKYEAQEILRLIGLEDKAGQLAAELSYGEQKLLALGCCVATEAPVLFLDEPVAGVAPEMARRIIVLLSDLQRSGKTIVFIEHDIEAVRQAATVVVVMDEGRIIACGPAKSVLDQPEIMEAYLG